MFREHLMQAVKEATTAEKYHFYSGFEYRIGTETKLFPAVWLLPAKLTGLQGREEGGLIYHVTLILLHLNHQYDEETKNRLWGKMEKQAYDIYNRLFLAEGVSHVTCFTTQPAEFTLTNHGELSLNVQFEVNFYFPNNLL